MSKNSIQGLKCLSILTLKIRCNHRKLRVVFKKKSF